jgi:mRNA interferase MazF
MKLDRGTIVLVDLDPMHGHEQAGVRPAIVISNPEVAAEQRYPLICVVPITGTTGEGALYPRLASGSGGLRKASWALIDQLRSVDKRRIQRVYGVVSKSELASIEQGLALFLSLGEGGGP